MGGLTFLLRRDYARWRALAFAFFSFGGVTLLFLFGAKAFGFDSEAAMRAYLGATAHGPWSLPVAIGLFTVLAFLGAPQIALIAITVAVLGPVRGAFDSWIGTLISAVIGYGIGLRAGARPIEAFGGPKAVAVTEAIAANGFLACFLVRLAPTAPFVFVNMAAGAARVRPRDFVLATAVGIIPKILVVAVGSASALRALAGRDLRSLVALALAFVTWAGLSWAAYAWFRRGSGSRGPGKDLA